MLPSILSTAFLGKLTSLQIAIQGVPAKEILVAAQPIHKRYLSERVPGLPLSASVAVFEVLLTSGLVGPSGLLLKDPRSALIVDDIYHASEAVLACSGKQ